MLSRAVLRRALLGAVPLSTRLAHAEAPPAPPPPDDGRQSPPPLEIAGEQGPLRTPPNEAPGAPRERGGCGSRTRKFFGEFRGTFGRAFIKDSADGYYGRLDLIAGEKLKRGVGPEYGITLGGSYWGSRDGGGVGIGPSLFAGVATRYAFAVVGGGFDWISYDRVKGDGGVGFLTPAGTAQFGFDFRPVRFGVEGRAQYRWHFGSRDTVFTGVGLFVGLWG